jgi:hypothetical protein
MAWRNALVTLDRIEDGRLYLQVGPEGFSVDRDVLQRMVLRGDGLDGLSVLAFQIADRLAEAGLDPQTLTLAQLRTLIESQPFRYPH